MFRRRYYKESLTKRKTYYRMRAKLTTYHMK